MKPKNIKKLQIQSKYLQARLVDRHTLAITSVSNPAASHIVTIHFEANGTVHARCTCPWAINGGVACSHVMAALDYLALKKGRKLSFWNKREEAQRQKQRVFRLAASPNGDGIWITSRRAA